MSKISILSLFFLAALPMLAPKLTNSDAFAQTTNNTDVNKFSSAMCKAYNVVTGTAGRAFAAFAIISVGIGFFTGKVSWGLMIGVAAGIAAMFGAPSIVNLLSGKTDSLTTKCTAATTATTS